MALHIPNTEKSFDAPTLEAANKRFRKGIGLQELFLEAAWAMGYTGRSFKADPSGVLRAAYTMAEISNVLASTVNKVIVESFTAVEQAWREIAATRPVNDFKAITGVRLIADAQFEKIGNDNELKHGTISDTTYTNQADTYGKMFSIGRKELINDDLGVLLSMPRQIGRGGALKLNEVFWTAFLDNASFFATGNSNYLSGVTVGTNDSRLNIEGLTRARKAFASLKDEKGKPIAAKPATLLVPVSLETEADILMNSMEVRDTTASTKIGTYNPHKGKFSVVASQYLDDSSFSNYSTTAWYLLANKNDIPTIEVVFLNGVEVPTVQTADADFNTLGIQMRGFFDFGVAKQEPRGGVKSKGAA
jgi:phage major head subunit gpT-like protein